MVRSVGGWSEAVSLRRQGVREMTDERILGSGDFVERVLKETDEKTKGPYTAKARKTRVEELIFERCKKSNIR